MPNVAELIKDHVTLSVDCVDRVYLNVYVPRLQASGGVVSFLRHCGQRVLSPAVFGQITETFKTGFGPGPRSGTFRGSSSRRANARTMWSSPIATAFGGTTGSC